MNKIEILEAIQEQTEAIKRLTEATMGHIARSLDVDSLVRAIVPAFVRELKRQDDMRLDAEFIALDPAEMKRRGREEMMLQNREEREKKAATKAREAKKANKIP
jgi:hypothetical protein